MACFSGLESRKPALQTTHHQPFSRPESWKPYIPMQVQDPSYTGPESWKHLAKRGNMPIQDSTPEKTPL